MNDETIIKSVNYSLLISHAHELAMLVKEKISNKEFEIDSVFGIPAGGILPAYILSIELDVPMVSTIKEKTLIVDDLIDSGQTLSKFPDNRKAVIYKKKSAPDLVDVAAYTIDNDWIDLPHEIGTCKKDIEDHIVRLIEYIGEDPNREGLKETPKRVAKAWKEMTNGYQRKFEDEVTVFDSEGFDQIVLLKDIEFNSICEHHMLGFSGKAHIAYIPDKKIIGISKLARVLDIYSNRLQNQERITTQIANCLEEQLKPKGVAVILEAKHSCMQCRGVKKQHSIMVTSVMKGDFKSESLSRGELLNLLHSS